MWKVIFKLIQLLKANLTAICFLLTYFVAIFLYAGAYWWKCSDGFYAPYTYHEKSWMDDTKLVEPIVARIFATWRESTHLYQYNGATLENVSNEIPDISARDFEVDNLRVVDGPRLSFDLGYNRQLPLPSGDQVILRDIDVLFGPESVSIIASVDHVREMPHNVVPGTYLVPSNSVRNKCSTYFLVTATIDNPFKEWGSYTRRTCLTGEQQSAIDNYINEYNGLSMNIGSNFPRMLYFSVVVITTLGLGDIVPLSDTARLLVGAEAITGIVLIGAFLNTLKG